MAFFGSLDIVGSALTAERLRHEVVLQNMSNAKSINENGEPYRRKQVVFRERPLNFSEELNKARGGVRVDEVIDSQRDFKRVYDPSNPQADENGYVMYPNVDMAEEMTDLMVSANSYEANLTALSVAKAIINKTLDMNK